MTQFKSREHQSSSVEKVLVAIISILRCLIFKVGHPFYRALLEIVKNSYQIMIGNCFIDCFQQRPDNIRNTMIQTDIVLRNNKSRYTNVKNHSEISRYFSVHVLPHPLRNSRELAKFYSFKLPWRLPGQWFRNKLIWMDRAIWKYLNSQNIYELANF